MFPPKLNSILSSPSNHPSITQIADIYRLQITDYPFSHRARLVKPMLSYDSAAIALSFVPAAGEAPTPLEPIHTSDSDRTDEAETETRQDDAYTYHHLRRSLYELCINGGVEVTSRYTVPSAHLTIARFVTQDDISSAPQEGNEGPAQVQVEGSTTATKRVVVDKEKVKKLVEKIEEISAWLEEEYWPREYQQGEDIKQGGEWVVGEGKGLDCRKGTLWYGGGETIRLGKGF